MNFKMYLILCFVACFVNAPNPRSIVILFRRINSDLISHSRLRELYTEHRLLHGRITPPIIVSNATITNLVSTGRLFHGGDPFWQRDENYKKSTICVNWPHSQEDTRHCHLPRKGNNLISEIEFVIKRFTKNSENLAMMLFQNDDKVLYQNILYFLVRAFIFI